MPSGEAFAMQKVESSSLFIRFTERPAQAGLSRFLALLLEIRREP
jgi:hypothetical protein